MSRPPRGGDMQQMLKQVQKMQKELQAAQERLKEEVVEASAGGGMVTVRITGDFEVKSVHIDPAAVDPVGGLGRWLPHLSAGRTGR